MSGIYFHIPFCKQACHYCDFHFSTSLKNRDGMLQAMHKELELRARELSEQQVSTIYFGGGTPSLLSGAEVQGLLDAVNRTFAVQEDAEITLEANPDDLDVHVLESFASVGVNRLSIGVQSFHDRDLELMNRAHNAGEAHESLYLASQFYNNISLDLIYGIPGLSMEAWQQNLEKAIDLGVRHISSYALTVEPRTALQKFIEKDLIQEPSDEEAEAHFRYMCQFLEKHGFIHYELSNFGKPGFFSKNNTAYWQGKSYLGIGPSAHSFDGERRSWNVANNPKYIRAIDGGELPITRETLSDKDRYNEYVMTGLRTIWGVSQERIREEFGIAFLHHFRHTAETLYGRGLLINEGDIVRVSERGKFLSDGIASELFMVNLNS